MSDFDSRFPPPEIGFMGPDRPAPPATPSSMACLRGPCRYYWHTRADAEMHMNGDVPGFLGHEYARQCMRHPGADTMSLADREVHSCSEWDPIPRDERVSRDERRREYTMNPTYYDEKLNATLADDIEEVLERMRAVAVTPVTEETPDGQ